MRRHEPADRRDTARGPSPGEPEPQPADTLLALQRSAGNRAVSAMLARQPTPTAPKAKPDAKAATMTVGLGEEFVIPVDSMSWEGDKAVSVVFDGTNPATPELLRAHQSGKHYETGFASTRALITKLSGVLVTEFRLSGVGDVPNSPVSMKLEAEEADHQPVE